MKKTTYKPSSKPHEPWQKPPKPASRTRPEPGAGTERLSRRGPGGKGPGAAQRPPRAGAPGARPGSRPGTAGRGYDPGESAPPRAAKAAAGQGPRRPEGRSKAPVPVKVAAAKRATEPDETAPFPLNKFLAHTGLCARRKAVEFIKEGAVTVNGRVVTEPGFKVTAADDIRYQDKKLSLKVEPVYILLNKPKGCITTTSDPRARHTVMDIVASATRQRVYPVGRLDRNTSGLLLLTNDGDLAQLLAHPSNNIVKVYHVTLDRALTKNDFERITAGVTLDDGHAPVDHLAYEDPGDRTQIGIEIHSGRNRIVRRIFEFMGYEVKALDRVLYAGLTKKNLPRGKWRFLSEKEVLNLKHFGKGR